MENGYIVSDGKDFHTSKKLMNKNTTVYTVVFLLYILIYMVLKGPTNFPVVFKLRCLKEPIQILAYITWMPSTHSYRNKTSKYDIAAEIMKLHPPTFNWTARVQILPKFRNISGQLENLPKFRNISGQLGNFSTIYFFIFFLQFFFWFLCFSR